MNVWSGEKAVLVGGKRLCIMTPFKCNLWKVLHLFNIRQKCTYAYGNGEGGGRETN